MARRVLDAVAVLVERRPKRMYELAPGSNMAIAPTAAWIQTLHVDLVGRLPDRRALVRRMAVRRSDSHREIARDLLQSDEYCRAQISALYRSLLDRDGDPDSVAAWTRALRSGIALQDVIATHHAQVRYIPITAEGRRSFSVTCLSSIYRMEKHGLKPPPGARKER
jgi:hypothetical protein